MVDKSDFQDDDGMSIEETAAAMHDDVAERLAEGEITEEEAKEEDDEIDRVAANVLDSTSAPDPEDPPPDED